MAYLKRDRNAAAEYKDYLMLGEMVSLILNVIGVSTIRKQILMRNFPIIPRSHLLQISRTLRATEQLLPVLMSYDHKKMTF